MKIKLVSENAKMPTRGSEYAAGYDLYATKYTTIRPGYVVMVDTGVAVELPPGTFGAVFPRSGLSTKKQLMLVNGVGVIDADYRGVIKVPLINQSKYLQDVEEGERVAQLVVMPYVNVELEEVEELSETERGAGGFGSSGRF